MIGKIATKIVRRLKRELQLHLTDSLWEAMAKAKFAISPESHHGAAHIPAGSIRSILLVNLDNVGDALWTTPTIRALKQGCPGARLVVWVTPTAREVFVANPYIDHLITASASDLNDSWGRIRIPPELSGMRFDLAVILEQHPETGALVRRLTYKMKIPYRLSSYLGRYKFLATHILPPNHPVDGQYWPAYHLQIGRWLGLPCEDSQLEVYLTPQEIEDAKRFLRAHGVGEGDLVVGIHPGSAQYTNFITKSWPPEGFAEVADRLAVRHGAKIVLTGSAADCINTNKIAALMTSRPVDSSGQLTLRQLAALISLCDVFLTVDTAPLHLAIALETPTVCIFGPTNPRLLVPPAGCSVVWKHVPCSPCVMYPERPPYWPQCIHPRQECLYQITSEEVLDTVVHHLLEGNSNEAVLLQHFR